MDPSERRCLEDVIAKRRVGATAVAAAAITYGAISGICDDMSRVEKNTVIPRVLRTLRMTSLFVIAGAAVCGVYVGVTEQVQNNRMKRLCQ